MANSGKVCRKKLPLNSIVLVFFLTRNYIDILCSLSGELGSSKDCNAYYFLFIHVLHYMGTMELNFWLSAFYTVTNWT